MYNIIPLILILLSLSVIIVITVRKFSVLANLDVDSIQSEKEAKFKEQIISNRLKRNITKWGSKVSKIFKFLANNISKIFVAIYNKLHNLKDSYQIEENSTKDIGEINLDIKFDEVNNLLKEESFDEAEKKLIEIIGFDSKNLKAFKELADVYFKKKNYEEAKQTYEHALRLIDQEEGDLSETARINFELALVEKEADNKESSLVYIDKAVKIEPNNPRYLDTILEISIMNKDKVSAVNSYEKLKEVNPENNKLEEFKKQIDLL